MAKQSTKLRKIGFIKYWFGLIFPRAIREIWEYIKRDLAMALLIIVIALATSFLSAKGILDAAIANGYLSDASSLFRIFIALVVLSLLYLLFSIFYYPLILHREQEAEKEKLEIEIEDLKAEKDVRPVLDNEEPQVINTQLPGVLVDNGLEYSPRMVMVSFFNKLRQKHESLIAKKVHAEITYYDSNFQPILSNLRGQWDIKPKWEATSHTGIIKQSVSGQGFSEVDFEPSRDKVHTIILAFWHVTDRYMYAVGSESFQYKNLRNPALELIGKEFYIQVNLCPAYSDNIERWFLLSHNEYGYLQVNQLTVRDANVVKRKIKNNKPSSKKPSRR